MREEYDVIVVGLGAMGAAATYHLATRGTRVLGLDRFKPPHDFGSSHGLSRIIREAYFEHTMYVPLVQRAYELWQKLEQKSGKRLLLPTGGLMIGQPEGALVAGARKSAEDHHLPHTLMSAAEVRQKFPALLPDEKMVAVWEPRAGILFPELAVQTHLDLAAAHGAELRFHEPLLKWEREPAGLKVLTPHGSYRSQRLVLSAGAWMSTLLSEPRLPLTIERQVLCWFEPLHAGLFEAGKLPIFICEYAPSRFFYGFPDLGDGVKAAIHHEGEMTHPDLVRREVRNEDTESVRSLLQRFVPGAAGPLRSAVVCIYTNTPDAHFLVGYHPLYPEIVVVSPCSGHGFKFSPVIGEIAATLATGGMPPFDLTLFKPERFDGLIAGH